MVVNKNMVVRQRDAAISYRVIDIVDAELVGRPDGVRYIVLIDIEPDGQAMPTLLKEEAFLDRLASKTWCVVNDEQPSIDLDAISDAERQVLQRRWAILQKALRHGVHLYVPQSRSDLARRLSAQKIASRPALYEILRIFWRGGGTMQCLLPRFSSCGGPGKVRVAAHDHNKTGRKRTTAPGVGLAMTKEHRKKLVRALLTTPVGKDGRRLRGIYSYLLISQYADHVTCLPNGRVEVDDADRVPTFEQFVYHYNKHYDLEERQRRRLRPDRFERLTRMMVTGTLKEVRGPGSRYYIDATVVDVYIVSRFNRQRIIGRPTLYLVVDQFSRLIVGMYIGLEPPCWAGAMLALWNCNLDKVQYCARYGVTIRSEEWPTGHMPLHLMGDRGEMISGMAEPLSMGFNIDMENAPPYRGEAKSCVERSFGSIQTPWGPYFPGYVDKQFLGRDAPPPALSAALDLDQLTRAFLQIVVARNHEVIRGYPGTPEQITQDVEFTAVSLWHWGVKNLRCDSREFPEEHLARYLWPEAKLKLSRRGLQFHRGLYYMGADIQNRPWFLKALQERQEFRARVHPQNLEQLYVLPNEERSGLINTGVSARTQKFASFSLSELVALESHRDRTNKAAEVKNLGVKLSMSKGVFDAITEAKSMFKASQDPTLSKSERLRGIRDNSKLELAALTIEALASNTLAPGAQLIDLPATKADSAGQALSDRTRQSVKDLIQRKRQSTG